MRGPFCYEGSFQGAGKETLRLWLCQECPFQWNTEKGIVVIQPKVHPQTPIDEALPKGLAALLHARRDERALMEGKQGEG